MNNPGFYENLRFVIRPRPTPWRWITVGTVLVVFCLIWLLVPKTTLFWLLFILVGTLTLLASYGWRQALAALHKLIHILENR